MFHLSDDCLIIDNDDSGYWSNITDNDNATCSVMPRDGATELLQRVHIDLECLADRINSTISSTLSLLHVTATWGNRSSCLDQRFLFSAKIERERTCETDILKPCGLIADNIPLNNTCEYTCPCVPTGNRCSLYFIQAQYSDRLMENLSLCEMKLTAVTEM